MIQKYLTSVVRPKFVERLRGLKNWPKWLKRFLTGATFFVALFAWGLAHEIGLILAQPVNAWTEDVSADCAVALTGGPNRVREGLELLSRGNVGKLVISGVHPTTELRDIYPQWPYDHDFHPENIVLERRSRTTYGNAQQTLALMEVLHCRDLVLITSRVHMYRALRMFRSEFPVDFPIVPRAVTSSSARPGWDEVGWEAIKLTFYSIWAF